MTCGASDQRPLARAAAALTWLAIGAVGVTGCSDPSPPSETAPGLATRLEKVDNAIASRDYAQARSSLERLMAATARAQADGRLNDEQAERILEAARLLLQQLPAEPTSVTPPPRPEGRSTAPPTATPDAEDEYSEPDSKPSTSPPDATGDTAEPEDDQGQDDVGTDEPTESDHGEEGGGSWPGSGGNWMPSPYPAPSPR